VQFWVPILDTLGNTEKSNMKMGHIFDPRFKGKFLCRLLDNFTTNSKRYPTSNSGSNNSSYGI